MPELTEKFIPSEVANCPECGGRLILEIDGWVVETGKPTPEGISAWCENYQRYFHRHYQSDWQDTFNRIRSWAMGTVRKLDMPTHNG